jgi:dTDP-4-amino-4,6-dideoxygalactose transaminase
MDTLCSESRNGPMSFSPIFCSNPALENTIIATEISSVVKDVLASGNYILGIQVSSFEKEFAAYLNSQFCIGVNSGTDALVIGLKSLGIGIGDEVILPSHTAVATAAAVVSLGAIPVFAEISNISMTVDPISVASLVTLKTRAVIAVHLYGYPCDLDALKQICVENDIFLVEDCAQSTGTVYKGKKVGTVGDIGCFSFYPTKNLGAIGDGGAIVTNNYATSEKCFALRQYGWDSDRVSNLNSTVSRLDEIQAAVLRIKLLHLDQNNFQRNEIAAQYRARINLQNLLLPEEPVEGKHTYHLFVIRVSKRDYMLEELAKLGIFAGIHYRKPVHLHPAFSSFTNNSNISLKFTEDVSNTILSLPMYPGLTDEEINRVVEGVMSVR